MNESSNKANAYFTMLSRNALRGTGFTSWSGRFALTRKRRVIYPRNDRRLRGQEPRLVCRESRKPAYASV